MSEKQVDWPMDEQLEATAQEMLNKVAEVAIRHGCPRLRFWPFLAWLEESLTLAEAARLERVPEARLEPVVRRQQ
jgi:hypothetical protein